MPEMAEERKKLYLLFGPDEYHVAETAKALVDELVPPADRAFGLEVFDGRQETVADVERVVKQAIEGILTMGFFGAGKTVWMRDITFICPDRRSKKSDDADGKPGGRLEQLAKLREVLAKIPDGHTLVLSGSGIDAITGSIVKDAQKMQKAGLADVRKFELPSKWKAKESAAALLLAEARKRKVPLSAERCGDIVARAGTDPRQLMSELEKLQLFCDGAEPSAEDIAAIVSPTADTEAMDFMDAFGMRDLKSALPALHRLLDARASDIGLIVQMQYRINDLLLIRDCLDRQYADPSFHWSESLPDDLKKAVEDLGERIAKSTTNAFNIRRFIAQAQKWTRLELRNARHVLDRAHARMTSIAMPSELVLEMALTEAVQRKS